MLGIGMRTIQKGTGQAFDKERQNEESDGDE